MRVSRSVAIQISSEPSPDQQTFTASRDFDDVSLGAALGPELKFGNYQVHASAGASRRWFGQRPFTDAATLQLDVADPISTTAQVRGAAAASRIWNHLNVLESGYSYSAQLALEKALSTTSGGGVTLTAIRQALRDPGYSTTSGQLSVFGWHKAGQLTYTGSLTYGRLIADERLLLYLDRRNEASYRVTVGATARQIQFAGLVPTVSLTWERNRSPIEIYDYGRTVFNIGVTPRLLKKIFRLWRGSLDTRSPDRRAASVR